MQYKPMQILKKDNTKLSIHFKMNCIKHPLFQNMSLDYVYIRPRTPFATSIAAKSFELTECVAYNSVTGRP